MMSRLAPLATAATTTLALLLVVILLPCLVRASVPEIEAVGRREDFPDGLVGLTLIEVYSPKCHHCVKYAKTMKKLVEHVNSKAESFHGIQIKQLSCSGDRLCQRIGIEALPTLRIYKNSTILDELAGAQPLQTILDWIQQTIESSKPPHHPPTGPLGEEEHIDAEKQLENDRLFEDFLSETVNEMRHITCAINPDHYLCKEGDATADATAKSLEAEKSPAPAKDDQPI